MEEKTYTLEEIRHLARGFYKSLDRGYFSTMGFVNEEDFANTFWSFVYEGLSQTPISLDNE